MPVGTAIFASVILISLVGLFIRTRGKWNWKKILLWILTAPVIVGILGGVSYFAYDRYQNRPRKMTEYWGVRLGITKEDVRFIKGAPKREEAGRGGRDIFEYEDYLSTYWVVFSTSNKVWLVTCATGACDAILGINTHTTSEVLVKKFGQPTKIDDTNKGLSRMYFYDKLNSYFDLTKNVVSTMGIRDTDNIPSD